MLMVRLALAASMVLRIGLAASSESTFHAESYDKALEMMHCEACAGPKTYAEALALVEAKGYDMSMRPALASNCTGAAPPDEVHVNFEITAITDINEKSQKVEVSGYWRLSWLDRRLAFNSTADGGCFDVVRRVHTRRPSRTVARPPNERPDAPP